MVVGRGGSCPLAGVGVIVRLGGVGSHSVRVVGCSENQWQVSTDRQMNEWAIGEKSRWKLEMLMSGCGGESSLPDIRG